MSTAVRQLPVATSVPAEPRRRRDPLVYPPYALTCIAASLVLKLLWFDHQVAGGEVLTPGAIANVGTLLLAVSWMGFVRTSRRLFFGLLLDLILSSVVFADLLYVRFFDDLLTLPVLLQAGQVGAVESSIVELIHPSDVFLFADLLALCVLWWVVNRGRSAPQSTGVARSATSRRQRASTALCLFLAGTTLLAQQVAMLNDPQVRGLVVAKAASLPVYRVTGLLGFHLYDGLQFASDHLLGQRVSPSDLKQVGERFEATRRTDRITTPTAPAFGEYQGKNVLMVQVEALQSFVVGRSIDGQEITPHLNDLAQQSAYFTNGYHQTGGGRTSDAELLTGCSLYPSSMGSAFVRFSGNSYDCLPKILRARGYSTSAHHAYYANYWNRDHMYPSMGYEKFHAIDDYRQNERVGWSLGDRSFLSQTVRKLNAERKPFYGMAVTLTSHHPYNVPNLATNVDVGRLRGTILGDYIETMSYVDSAIGSMIVQLKRTGLWGNTVVVIYGDHDSGIEDWRLFDELFGRSIDDYERAQIRNSVPILMHFPDNRHSGEIERPTGQIDVAPTLAHLLGVPARGRYLLGDNAFAGTPSRVVLRDGGVVDDDVLFIPGEDGKLESGHCFHRVTGQRATPDACLSAAVSAREDLALSDLVLENDLISTLRTQGSTPKR